MRTVRQQLIDKAVLWIVDNQISDLSNLNISTVIEGRCEICTAFDKYYGELSRQQWRLLVGNIRAAALRHPRAIQIRHDNLSQREKNRMTRHMKPRNVEGVWC